VSAWQWGGFAWKNLKIVRSWIDVRRLLPLRVEKYASSGQLLRRIDTTRVVANAGR